MKKRIGVFGGMFDPVHNGHLALANTALKLMCLDKLILVPCRQPSHRAACVASAEHRLAMTRLACSANTKIHVESIELDRLGTSYTIDTLYQVKLSEPSARIVLVLGVDAFNGFLFWEGWGKILEFCNLFIVSRPNVVLDPSVLESTGLANRCVSDLDALFAEDAGSYCYCADVSMNYASSEVRQKLVKSESLDHAMDSTVLEYIDKHSLYTL
tara:strand:+ start:9086 stop:9724 length:639 start_codon:yes stop_codon:yes gene_type:complete